MTGKLLPFVVLGLMLFSQPGHAADQLVDGVPLPSDAALDTASPPTALQRQWSGVWIGAWGGTLKHILLVEAVAEDGAARVVYSVAAGWQLLQSVLSSSNTARPFSSSGVRGRVSRGGARSPRRRYAFSFVRRTAFS